MTTTNDTRDALAAERDRLRQVLTDLADDIRRCRAERRRLMMTTNEARAAVLLTQMDLQQRVQRFNDAATELAEAFTTLVEQHIALAADSIRLRQVLRDIMNEAGSFDTEPPHELPDDHPIVLIYERAEAALAADDAGQEAGR